MINTDQLNPHTFESLPEITLDHLTHCIELAFADLFYPHLHGYPWISPSNGRLSIHSEQTAHDILSDSLRGNCADFSDELQKNLAMMGILTHIAFGVCSSSAKIAHIFLITEVNREEIIIDPTIGQFLTKHTHTFIGSREQLKLLVFNAFNSGDFNDLKCGSKSAEELYLNIWGTQSRIAVTDMLVPDEEFEIHTNASE